MCTVAISLDFYMGGGLGTWLMGFNLGWKAYHCLQEEHFQNLSESFIDLLREGDRKLFKPPKWG
jgi:hypothetical protein